MNLTPAQQNIYNIILTMNNNGPLTDNNRHLLLSVDFSKFGITENDKLTAIRHYEHIVGLTLQAV
jgi:hypothetical protein